MNYTTLIFCFMSQSLWVFVMGVEVPNKTFFITGTDTGIGKTVVCAGLLRALLDQGSRAAGMKPVVSGSLPANHLIGQTSPFWEDVLALDVADRHALNIDERSVYRLNMAASPHFAASEEGIEIVPQHLISAVINPQLRFDTLLIEGVGGVRVPLAPCGFDVRDYICALGSPVVLVVGLRLGCINHALLTLESLVEKNISIVAWVANAGIDDEYTSVANTVHTLEDRMGIPCSAVLPRFIEHQSLPSTSLEECCSRIEAVVSLSSKQLAPLARLLLSIQTRVPRET
jgi:dethiobiotin synthetase